MMTAAIKDTKRVSVLLECRVMHRISKAAAAEGLPPRMFALQLIRKTLARRHPEKCSDLYRAWTQAPTDDKLTFAFERFDIELIDQWVSEAGKRTRSELIREILTEI